MKNALIGGLVAALCVLLCSLYAARREAEEARTEMERLKQSYVRAQFRIVKQSISAGNAALRVRDGAYARAAEAGERAALGIAGAAREGEAENEVDPDGRLPRALSDALIVQRAQVCAASLSCDPAGGDLRSQSAAGSAR